METLVRTPQDVFIHPQRLVVPLFQRPYVWTLDSQWEPLWNDVVRVAERLLRRPDERPRPHFLGAVVLQQIPRPTGLLQERTIIDGQQRLTTLQLLLDALHAQLTVLGAVAPAMRLEPLVSNAAPFRTRPEDRFKVWPTNRDRAAFNDVMAAEPPVDHSALPHRCERLVECHRFFSEEARDWLALDTATADQRAIALETTVRDSLQMVVIDLAADENAQEIFETLNARGAQLTAADLIKNFVFQQLVEGKVDVEDAYERNWKDFETGFWETEINVGRVRQARSSVFLNHWLISRTGEEILAREVFQRFKTFALESPPMAGLLGRIQRAAAVYRDFVNKASALRGPADRIALFGYRTGVLESEVVKPLVLHLLDPDEPAIADDEVMKALDAIESWMVRRMLVRATTKNYNQVVAELISKLRVEGRDRAGSIIEDYLAAQTGASRYWPDDRELLAELRELLAYRRLSRARLRMVLEAVEDHRRGWRDGKAGLGGERVARGALAIEHVMPRKWTTHWPPSEGFVGEADRDRLVHTIGNLTLLTGRLNSKVSNGPWLGPEGKRNGLQQHDVLVLNRELLAAAGESWTDAAIRRRTDELAKAIAEIWSVPPNHRSEFGHDKPRQHRKVQLADLIAAGFLQAGAPLFPRKKQFAARTATLLGDGSIDVDGTVFARPGDAGTAIVGKKTGGMWFFLVDQASRRSLRDVKRDYINQLAVDTDDDESEEGQDDDEG